VARRRCGKRLGERGGIQTFDGELGAVGDAVLGVEVLPSLRPPDAADLDEVAPAGRLHLLAVGEDCEFGHHALGGVDAQVNLLRGRGGCAQDDHAVLEFRAVARVGADQLLVEKREGPGAAVGGCGFAVTTKAQADVERADAAGGQPAIEDGAVLVAAAEEPAGVAVQACVVALREAVPVDRVDDFAVLSDADAAGQRRERIAATNRAH
jgi:hypothetical protein